jgi:hypothetical protein
MLSPRTGNNLPLLGSITLKISSNTRQEKEGIQIGKEKIKLPLFADDVIV